MTNASNAAVRRKLAGQYEEARALFGVGDLPRAQVILEGILRSAPGHSPSLHFLGLIAVRNGDKRSAVELFARSVSADPHNAIALYCHGQTLHERGDMVGALASLGRAIAVNHDYAEAYFWRANSLLQLGRFDEALQDYGRAVAIRDDFAEAHLNRGSLLAQLYRLDAALLSTERALSLLPDSPDARLNYGNVLRELGRFDVALRHYDSLIAAHPDFAAAYCNRAYTLLLLGQYERGWSDHEWRLRNPHSAAFLNGARFDRPRWLGTESLKDRTILIYGEQGLGDNIQFCRYAPLLAEAGARVIIEVPRALRSLVSTADGVSEVVARGDRLPEFDCHCPLMSLPHAFRSTLGSIPARVPYLKADRDKVRRWSELLLRTGKLRVGIVWSGGFRADQPRVWPVNARRNIALAQLASLGNPAVEFVSLQVGEPATSELAQQTASGENKLPLIDHTRMLDDFSDTAALIENLDLVIAVDTSVAHVAGALGKPVWLLNRYDTCWRWLLQRQDSPWYPTAKIYRQQRPGDWGEVLRRVSADLGKVLDARGHGMPTATAAAKSFGR